MKGCVFAERFGLGSRAAGPSGDRVVYSLFRYADIAATLQDPDSFSSEVMNESLGTFLGRIIIGMGGAEHRFWRGLLLPVFSRRRLEHWGETAVRPMIDGLVASLARRGECDLISDLADAFPVQAVYRVLGLADDVDEQEQFAQWAEAILGGRAEGLDPAEAEKARRVAFEAADHLYEHIASVVHTARTAGTDGPDLIHALLTAEFEGRALDDEEIVLFVRGLLPAAADTTTRAFGNLMACLLNSPDELRKLRADPGLTPDAVNESLRYEPPSTVLPRLTTKEVEVGGTRIPAGAGITLVLGSGNRDEEVFEDGDSFRITRTGHASLSFGGGPHMCVGMQLAKVELVAAASSVLTQMPELRVASGSPAPLIEGITERRAVSLPVEWRT
jgi:cytochrome P450